MLTFVLQYLIKQCYLQKQFCLFKYTNIKPKGCSMLTLVLQINRVYVIISKKSAFYKNESNIPYCIHKQ